MKLNNLNYRKRNKFIAKNQNQIYKGIDNYRNLDKEKHLDQNIINKKKTI